MLLIKNLIYWLILVISAPIAFIITVLSVPFPQGPNKIGRAWARLLLWSLKNIIGLNYKVSGRENIPNRPAIICSKHQSGWETLALQEIFPLQVFVAKKSCSACPSSAGV